MLFPIDAVARVDRAQDNRESFEAREPAEMLNECEPAHIIAPVSVSLGLFYQVREDHSLSRTFDREVPQRR